MVHILKIIRNFAVEKVMMSEIMRSLTEKEEYYKLITDEKSNHIGTNANGAGSQCVRRKNIGSLSFRERYLSLRKEFSTSLSSFFVFVPNLVPLPQVCFRLYHVLYAVRQGGEEVYARNPLHLIYAVHKLVLALGALVVSHHISYGLRVGLQT